MRGGLRPGRDARIPGQGHRGDVRYRNLIREKCGAEPEGARLVIKWSPHDFGTYGELVCEYDNENALDYALHVESGGPLTWDGEGATLFGA